MNTRRRPKRLSPSGGGIASSIARALGAGRRQDADALVLHAMLIAVGFGVAFSLALLLGGRSLYAQMGGSDASPDAALTYSHWVFGGATLVWLFHSLAAVIRGTGNMQVPANVTVAGVVLVVPLSLLISLFGADPAMLEAGTLYLRTVGPLYGFFGVGLVLYFASQGAGRLLWPVAGNIARLAVAAIGGWLSIRWGGGLAQVFMTQAAALAVYGIVIAAAIAGGAWFGRTSSLLRRIRPAQALTST